MQVHKVESDSTLQITLDSVDRNSLTNVQDPAIADIGLGDRLIHAFVLPDPISEISLGIFSGHPLVVGITRLNFESDVRSDYDGVITEGFEEEELQSRFLRNSVTDLFSANRSANKLNRRRLLYQPSVYRTICSVWK